MPLPDRVAGGAQFPANPSLSRLASVVLNVDDNPGPAAEARRAKRGALRRPE